MTEPVKKAGRKAATGKPFKKGDKRINRSKPGTGRPPDQFRAMCRALVSSDKVRENVEKILADPFTHEKLYVGALKWASEHGYGKPDQPLTGKDGGPIKVTVRIEREGRRVTAS